MENNWRGVMRVRRGRGGRLFGKKKKVSWKRFVQVRNEIKVYAYNYYVVT